jgi:hypothetical protein
MCLYCAHYNRESKVTCAAFPDGIPWPILLSEVDHRKPYPGDGDLQFQPDPEHPLPYPEWFAIRFEGKVPS